MAIDPKELRIGSHVEYEDKRLMVVGIADFESGLRCGVALKVDGDVLLNADPNRINPIPITEELLTELGFEKTDFHGKSVYRKLYKDVYPLGKMYYGLFYDANAEAWHFQVHTTDSECEYLHELEALAYHVTKKELIND